MRRRTLLLPIAVALLVLGCDDDHGGDAGLRDAGLRDAGNPDAGIRDGGDARIDGGESDGGSLDAGDGGSLDAGDGALPQGARSAANVFFVGHSLINFHMPAMLDDIARSAGVTHAYAAQIGNGAPLWWIWEHPEDADGEDADVELPTGRYDVLVMTELIPIAQHVQYSDTADYAGRFYDLAMESNPATQVYFYETWYDVEDPAWRANIDADREIWLSVVDEVNATRSGRDMLLVPAGAALGALVDRIAAGEVPGLSSRRDLFVDPIHLNDIGNYFIALVQFATIYRQSPVGVTATTTNPFGGEFEAPHPEAARIMQEIAWDVVSSDPRAGIAR